RDWFRPRLISSPTSSRTGFLYPQWRRLLCRLTSRAGKLRHHHKEHRDEEDAHRGCRDPAPVGMASGRTPSVKASGVMAIGRNLRREGSMTASIMLLPCARRSLANSTIKIAFFAARPNRSDQNCQALILREVDNNDWAIKDPIDSRHNHGHSR